MAHRPASRVAPGVMAQATIFAGVFPALAGGLVLIGIIVSQPGNMVARLAVLRNVGGVLFGAGLAWLGLALLSG